ncbi:MAG TPA: alcohol dehydrogenase catalytic domain-containing protein, partial [Candidatus Bathyarchaeia archaeon]|nr:alcohol dehydrogenase catalytic domain-containing protein [Candidatus Bathyarchaeia archaeon]
MKALVLVDYGRFELRDVPAPAIGPHDVLVRVKACGICGSDVHGMDGSTGRRRPPVIMGHEAAGVIAATRPDVAGWNEGDRVTFDSTVYCGDCGWCRDGRVNLCDNRRVLGVSCADYVRDGAFAEYVAVPHHILYRLPDNLRFEQATMVEPLSVAVHATGRAPLKPGDGALVVGSGMIGLLIVQTLRAAGCECVVAVDVDPARLDLARKLGAHHAVNAHDEISALGAIMEHTGGRGVDSAFEAVGITPAIRLAVKSLCKGGSLVMVGNVSPQVDLPLQDIVTRE